MFTKEAQALAKATVEAIKKIAGEKECPECKGKGGTWSKRHGYLWHAFCNGTGKVKRKWKWSPVVGEQFIGKEGIPIVIAGIVDVPLVFGTENRRLQYLSMDKVKEVFVKDITPLLPWERIRKILKQFGYSFSITSGASGGQITVYGNVGTDKLYEKYHNNDLQREVMQAVIELGKEK